MGHHARLWSSKDRKSAKEEVEVASSVTTTITYSHILRGLEWTADDYRFLMGITGSADNHRTTADVSRSPKTTADSDSALTDLYDYYWELL
jgi:hypothetical protein